MADKNKLDENLEDSLDNDELDSEISENETDEYEDEAFDGTEEFEDEENAEATGSVSVAADGESKAERKARAKEEYRRREMERQQLVMSKKAKEEARAAKTEGGNDDKKRAPVKEVKKDKPGFFKRIGKWFKGVFGELKHVTWPSFKTVAKSTTVVLVVTGIFLVVAMLMDGGLGWVYNWFTGKL